ncbi:hypothetical protein ACFVYR_37575 [Streptomyces sp. NPDC058284]|uniref:hypothetical protein n=1 Tax=unclassified Streptomyces TaxID=2593676 RepID=UPI0036655C63
MRTWAATAVLAGAIAVPVAGAATASAGTNGQQVQVSTYYSDRAKVCGTDQNGSHVCTGWFQTPGSGYYGVPGYWFKGKATIHGINDNTGTKRQVDVTVPKSQSGNWWSYDGRAHKTL